MPASARSAAHRYNGRGGGGIVAGAGVREELKRLPTLYGEHGGFSAAAK